MPEDIPQSGGAKAVNVILGFLTGAAVTFAVRVVVGKLFVASYVLLPLALFGIVPSVVGVVSAIIFYFWIRRRIPYFGRGVLVGAIFVAAYFGLLSFGSLRIWGLL